MYAFDTYHAFADSLFSFVHEVDDFLHELNMCITRYFVLLLLLRYASTQLLETDTVYNRLCQNNKQDRLFVDREPFSPCSAINGAVMPYRDAASIL